MWASLQGLRESAKAIIEEMIKFFRRIRYDPMETKPTSAKASAGSKTGKYLKYAIGEIVLVVIGILIALQINNWNEYRKDRIKEQAILAQLQEEYESNLAQLDSKIQIRNIVIKSSQKLLDYIEDSEPAQSDSIFYNMTRGSYRPTFDPIKNDIISSNKLSLIQNDRLRKLLSQWASNVYQLNEEEWFWRDYVVDVRLPFIAENQLTRKLYYKSIQINEKLYLLEDNQDTSKLFKDTSREIDFYEILKKPALEAILVTGVFACTDANLISETLRKNILEILALIHENLDDKTLPQQPKDET